jgi:hypothetical protein
MGFSAQIGSLGLSGTAVQPHSNNIINKFLAMLTLQKLNYHKIMLSFLPHNYQKMKQLLDLD